MITLLRKHFFAYLKEITLRVLFLESMDMTPQRIDRIVLYLYQQFVDPEILDQWMDEAVQIFHNAVKALLSSLYDDVSATLVMCGKALIVEDDGSPVQVVKPDTGCVVYSRPVMNRVPGCGATVYDGRDTINGYDDMHLTCNVQESAIVEEEET